MNTLIHADIFFFVTTVSVALLTILVVIAWIYVMKILANVREISDKAKVEGGLLLNEVRTLREDLHEKRFKIVSLVFFIRRLIRKYA
jgi:hypothetical protein